MKSRPLQYLGLATLLLASLVVIFFPIGSAPQPQAVTVPIVAPQPFDTLVPKGTSPVAAADEAIVKAFPNPPTPGALTIGADPKTATVEVKATTQTEARQSAARLVSALGTKFKGAKLAPDFSPGDLPNQPLVSLGKYAVFPSRERNGSVEPAVKLGLDLQGGVNLVLQVRRAMFPYTIANAPTDPAAREEVLNQIRAKLAATSGDLGLRGADVAFNKTSPNQIEVRTQATDRAQFNAQTKAIGAAMASLSGVQIAPTRAPQFYVPDVKPGQTGTSETDLLNTTAEIIRTRVDKLGVSEPLIQTQAPNRVIVQLPGIKDPQKAVDVIGQTTQMEIRLLPEGWKPSESKDGISFTDAQGNPVPTAQARDASELLVSGIDVKPTTNAGFGQDGKALVSFELQGEGSRKFAQVTSQVAGKGRFIPVFLDDRVVTAPTVNQGISGSGQISGGFKDIEEAKSLALLLNSGALPAPIDVVENRTVSATLGQDSLVKSLRAGAIGLLAVAISW